MTTGHSEQIILMNLKNNKFVYNITDSHFFHLFRRLICSSCL
jgi:hypothetical protein